MIGSAEAATIAILVAGCTAFIVTVAVGSGLTVLFRLWRKRRDR